MPQIINTNMMSLNSQRNLDSSQGALKTSLQRLSSGLRINSAKDDAAGLAISERFTSQIRGLNQAVRNANDGISLAQTSEGALTEYGAMAQRVRELAVQSANDTNSSSDRQALNNEVSQLLSEMSRIATSTDFNGQKVLDGSLESLDFQVGANRGQTITVTGTDARTSEVGAAVLEGDDIASTTAMTGLTDDMTINGVSVDLSSVSTTADIVDAINAKTGDTGVTATQDSTTEVEFTSLSLPSGTTSDIIVNGTTVTIADGASADAAAATISDGVDGVTATVDSDGNITLSSSSDIVITDADDVLGGGSPATTYAAAIDLTAEYGNDISVAGTDAPTALGLTGTAQQMSLADVSVATKEDSNDALRTLDYSLQMLNGFRSELGAIQNRFESTISNLSTTSENLSAARSRIQDADFAAETAELTRTQILQQAGTAMLAQANQIPQNVLSLLQ